MPRVEILTIPQAAAATGIAPSTLRRMCALGEVRGAVKAGRDWLIPANSLKRIHPRPVGRPQG